MMSGFEDAADFLLERGPGSNEDFEEHFNGQALPPLPRFEGGRKSANMITQLYQLCPYTGTAAAALPRTV